MPIYPLPSDPDFRKKFKAYALRELKRRNEEMAKEKSSAAGTSGVSTANTTTASTSAPGTDSSCGNSETPVLTPATTTDENLSDLERLEKRLGQKIDDAFAILGKRLEKDFRLLHATILADWDNTQ